MTNNINEELEIGQEIHYKGKVGRIEKILPSGKYSVHFDEPINTKEGEVRDVELTSSELHSKVDESINENLYSSVIKNVLNKDFMNAKTDFHKILAQKVFTRLQETKKRITEEYFQYTKENV